MAEILRSIVRDRGETAKTQFSRRLTTCRGAVAVAVSLCFYAHGLGHSKAAEAESKPGVPATGRGAVIASQGIPPAPACALCHAFDGTSDGTGAFPRIAALPAAYFAAQIRDFASGVRDNAIMSPIAKSLTPEEVNSVATYYAEVKAPFPPLKSANPSLVKLGEQLATAGDAAKGIPGCDLCHGPQGNGQPGIAPYLGGQYAEYIAFTLHMWQRGYRKNSPDVMEPFARKLDDQQIAAVAAYYQQVRASPAGLTRK